MWTGSCSCERTWNIRKFLTSNATIRVYGGWGRWRWVIPVYVLITAAQGVKRPLNLPSLAVKSWKPGQTIIRRFLSGRNGTISPYTPHIGSRSSKWYHTLASKGWLQFKKILLYCSTGWKMGNEIMPHGIQSWKRPAGETVMQIMTTALQVRVCFWCRTRRNRSCPSGGIPKTPQLLCASGLKHN